MSGSKTGQKKKAKKTIEAVTLGIGSRASLAKGKHKQPSHSQPRGLLAVPGEVEAEIKKQEATHVMNAVYRKTLSDHLTLEHYFPDVEVAFRRTLNGIEVVAVGMEEIAEFRQTTAPEERQGVVYGVG
jgi:hypothetical protein